MIRIQDQFGQLWWLIRFLITACLTLSISSCGTPTKQIVDRGGKATLKSDFVVFNDESVFFPKGHTFLTKTFDGNRVGVIIHKAQSQAMFTTFDTLNAIEIGSDGCMTGGLFQKDFTGWEYKHPADSTNWLRSRRNPKVCFSIQPLD